MWAGHLPVMLPVRDLALIALFHVERCRSCRIASLRGAKDMAPDAKSGASTYKLTVSRRDES
jgi:hypothetical protein